VKEGDREAFADLVEAHQARVLGTVVRMLGPETMDAEDIAQQVFLRVWKSAARYEPTAKFTTWLFTITRNLVFNESRRRKNRPTTSLDAPVAGSGDESNVRQIADETAASPESALLAREMTEAIDAAIAELPEQQRLAVVLRRYEELPYEEIARVLDLSVPAVKSLLFRARTFLRERLEKYLAQ
jgi:RNA polymerase sigma-70 factor (ECF subfamily)